jgi:hypothetical protein
VSSKGAEPLRLLTEGGAIYLGDSSSGNVVSRSILPLSGASRVLGGSTSRWQDIYGFNVHYNNLVNDSDSRLKNIVKKDMHALDFIEKLKPTSFTWKDNRDEYTHYGLIAQELNEVAPEMVYSPKEEMWGVDYNKIVPYLVKAVQELKTQNDKLQQKIEEIEKGL